MPKRLLGLKSIQKRVILVLFKGFLIDFISFGFNSEKMVPGKVFIPNHDPFLVVGPKTCEKPLKHKL